MRRAKNLGAFVYLFRSAALAGALLAAVVVVAFAAVSTDTLTPTGPTLVARAEAAPRARGRAKRAPTPAPSTDDDTASVAAKGSEDDDKEATSPTEAGESTDGKEDSKEVKGRSDEVVEAAAPPAPSVERPDETSKPATPPPPPPPPEGTEPPHKLEFYGLFVPAVEMTESFAPNLTAMAPTENAPSTRGGSFSGPYTNNPATQGRRARTISAPSHVGVRGRWEFSPGHYGRFQWEVGSLTFGGTLPVTMYSPGLGLVSRNSAAFMGGPWGEIGFGIWDTPFAMVGNYAPGYGPLINASTLMSSSIMGGMPFANGAVPGFPAQNFCIVEVDPRTALGFTPALSSDLTQCANNAMNFDRRAANSIIYQSPTLMGFALRSQLEVNFRRSSDFEAPRRNPWASSNSLSFTGAGFFAAFGIEVRQDFIADAAQLARGLTLGGLGPTAAQWSSGATGISDSREQGMRANIRYTAPFGLTLGVLVEQLEYYARYAALTVGDITALRKRAGRVEVIYQAGRHTIGGAYHRALAIEATLAPPNVFNADGTAGWGLTSAYAYRLGKGLSVTAYFMTIVNSVNARYNVVFQGLPSPAGADLRAFGTGMRYSF